MNNLTQTDIDVILQYSGQVYSDKASDLVKDLSYGRKCVTKNRTNLMLLNIYLEALEDYRYIADETLSVAYFEILQVTIGAQNQLFANGVAITPVLTATSAVPLTNMNQLITQINNYSDSYTAVLDSATFGKDVVKITGTCKNVELTYNLSVTVPVSLVNSTDFTGGRCEVEDGDNCFTEEEIQQIIEKISILTKLCFQEPGGDYYPAED